MKNTGSLWRLTATQMRQGYVSNLFSPIDVLNSCLQRLSEVEPHINSMTYVRAAEALREAEASAARYRNNHPLSALDGIPITIKDNILVEGMPATWGTFGLRNNISEYDEIAVARIRDAGMLIMGKTNLCEFTLEGYTSNRLFGTSRNPWDINLTPGGSSGGAAAGVAAGIAPLALGTDAGGSIRRPASHCGLIGIKPSIGQVARKDTLPLPMLDFDVIGILGRDVEDVAQLFGVIRGPATGDWRSWAPKGASADPRPMNSTKRILYAGAIGDFPVDPEIRASCHQALGAFERMGFEIEERPIPFSLGFTTDKWPIVAQLGLARLFDNHPSLREHASDQYIEMARLGEAKTISSLWEVLEQTEILRRQSAEFFEEFDYIVTPAAAALPWEASTSYPTIIDGRTVGPRGHAIFASWVNAAGLPAIAVPCRESGSGLPIGVQVVGPFGSDDALLRVASQYEKEMGKWRDWPDLSGSS